MEFEDEFVPKFSRNKLLQARKRFPGSSDRRTFRLCPTGLGKASLLSVFISFHFLVLLGPCTLLKDGLERERTEMGELSRHTGGTQGSARVWSGMRVRRSSLQWPIVSRLGLPKMEADLIFCLSHTLPSSSLQSTSLQSINPGFSFTCSGRGCTLHISKCQTLGVSLGQVLPRCTFWGLAQGVCEL